MPSIACAKSIEQRDSAAIGLLQSSHAVAPDGLLDRRERDEQRHVVPGGARAIAEGPSREDVGRIEREDAEEGVDVVHHASVAGTGVTDLARVVGGTGDQPRGRLSNDVGLVIAEEAPGARPGRFEPTPRHEGEQRQRADASDEAPARDLTQE